MLEESAGEPQLVRFSRGRRALLGTGSHSCPIPTENLAAFSPCPDYFSKAEFKSNGKSMIAQ